ncbi:MAG: hypothetical protein ABFD00_08245 [Chloroherpetonaceae bacterium]
MKKSLIIFLIILGFNQLQSQGFDWEYSARLPYKIPRAFIGGGYSLSYNQNIADFPFFENNVYSLNFHNSNGIINQFLVSFQYWEKPIIAVFANVFYKTIKTDFSQRMTYPRSNGIDNWETTYQTDMNESRDYLGISIGGKYRLFGSYFSIGAQVNSAFLLSSSISASEQIISPISEYYIDGTKKRDIKEMHIPDFKNLQIFPEIFIGYDFSPIKGLYMQANLKMQIPIFNSTISDKYYDLPIGIEITIYKAIKMLN